MEAARCGRRDQESQDEGSFPQGQLPGHVNVVAATPTNEEHRLSGMLRIPTDCKILVVSDSVLSLKKKG